MFSGIISLDGMASNVPDIDALSQFNQSNVLLFTESEFVIASRDFDFSRIPTTSPTLSEYEGIFTILPLTVMCLCVTNCLAPLLVGDTPKRKTVSVSYTHLRAHET